MSKSIPDSADSANSEVTVGPHVPRRGNRLVKAAALLFLGLIGWQIRGILPDQQKFIIIGAPHTSNWDFVLVMATAMALNVRISWMAKHSLFKRPFAALLRWLGGIPINRKAADGVVGESVSAFNKQSSLILCITPEGTRSKVHHWKSGFYRIAQGAKVPILLAAFDYRNKAIVLGPTVQPTGSYDNDLAYLKSHYAQYEGKHKQKM